ncbi:hypothetical protein V8F20_002979 [Naviculisporaceae sp. PSN 640]
MPSKDNPKRPAGPPPAGHQSSTPPPAAAVAAELKNDTANLGYKLRVLLYDLRNVGKDHSSESRTLVTTHPTYISSPYFTPDEADTVLNSLVVVTQAPVDDSGDVEEADGTGTGLVIGRPSEVTGGVVENGRTTKDTMTVEQAIQAKLSGFLDKRKASGDARPCGPHDMAIIYEEIFNIIKNEVEGDEKFLSRLRRCGV